MDATPPLIIEAFHGGQHEDPRWFSTDVEHCRYFGDVEAYRITLATHLRIDAKSDPRVMDLQGYQADQALYSILEEACVSGLIVAGWEGKGQTILIGDSAVVESID